MTEVTYRTIGGEMVDEICQGHYGRTVDVVEAVLEANPGLASHGPQLPAGLLVTLPGLTARAAAAPVRRTVKLWD